VKLKMSPGSPGQLQSASLGWASAGGGIGLGMGIVSANGGNCVNGNGNGNGNGNVVVGGANGNGNAGGGESPVPRRNSLGDLKIPARISQAQVSLRRDIGFVREFAASIERTSSMPFSSSLLSLWLTKHNLLGWGIQS
jgi:hypothetical protein